MTLSALHPLTVVAATPDDFEAVMDIYDNTTRWLHSIGHTYWAYPIPDWLRELVRRDIAEAHVFVCRAATGEIVGTFRLGSSDPRLWPEDGTQAAYLHGFGTRREFKGQGIGNWMLDWIKQYAHRQGRSCLRLDCEASNAVLRAYYERQGFKFCGEVVVNEYNYTGARYELALP